VAPASLELDEAVPLLGAYASRLAQDLSVRALLIKGAPATALGMRAHRPSVDVDLWVEPAGFSSYQSRLEECGWRVKPGPATGDGWGHAVTLLSDEWPCAIDLHRRFPGFLTDDSTAFELAWRGRTQARAGHVEVAVPGRVVAAAITVLHAARSMLITETAGDRTCALAAARAFTADERVELEELVTTTRSAEPLQLLLAATGCPASVQPAASAQLDEWRIRLRAQSYPVGPWLVALRQASWRRRLSLLMAAARPVDQDYADVAADHTRYGAMRATVHRWRRGVRMVRDSAVLFRLRSATRPSSQSETTPRQS
jgi:hypothetical protein